MKENRGKLCLWRLIAIACIIPAWIISIAPFASPIYTKILPAPNISQNVILLEKLNMSNLTVLCPHPFTYSPDSQMCQVKCGTAFLGFDYYSKRIIYAVIGLVNIAISIAALCRTIKIRKELQFKHNPIIIGVTVNLLQSFVIGIPDVIGSDIFHCENKDIDYDRLNANPPVQVHIIGALVSLLGISNRLWFVMALALIFLSVSFPLKDLFGPRRNRIVIWTIEILVCFVYPLICALAAFTPFSGYRLSESILLPVQSNSTISTIFGFTPHLVISAVTITIIVLIIYKIHTKIQMSVIKTGKKQSVHPIEIRLMFFSVVYFILISIICISLVINFIRKNRVEFEMTDFLAMLTLQSPYVINNTTNSPSMMNQVLSILLNPEDQLLVQERVMPFVFQIRGLAIRMMFIFVLPVLNFTCPRIPYRKKQQKQVENGTSQVVFCRNTKE